MLHTSQIELDKKALKNNIDFIKNNIGNKVKYSMVVKANAYGHGIEEIIPAAEDCGVNHFSVFSIAEAKRAFACMKKNTELMIMGWVDGDHFDWALENGVSFFVFTQYRLNKTLERAKKIGAVAKIHLELETGMYRTGLVEEELEAVAKLINDNKEFIEVEGLCTHYAGAENLENHERIVEQINTFKYLSNKLENLGIKPKLKHTACSAAMFNYPETIMDMVRVGVSSYGFWPNLQTKFRYLADNGVSDSPLLRVLEWKSFIMSVNKVPKGKYISYGTSFLTTRDSRIATIPVGYGYGFSRNLGNNGYVLVKGERAKIVGVVNMNMLVIDVTDIKDVDVDDVAILIGEQGDKEITVSSFSEMNNSLNYEMLTRLPDHIPRVVVGD